MQRRLEYFEDQLDETAMGREIIAVIDKHAEEVMFLINKNKHVLVTWNKNKGPDFIKSFMDSGYEEDIHFRKEVDGVRIEKLLMAMSEVLMDYGSPDLKQNIGKYAPMVIRTATETKSLMEILKILKQTGLQEI